MQKKIKISPSILSADFANLASEIKAISSAGADYIHIDVMDGNFVPNITIGSEVVSHLRKYSNLPFDVHLMVKNPENHIENFAKAGADIITIHAEATTHPHRILNKIKSLGKKAGLSLVPSTSENILDYLLDEIDLILVMTVNPGFGGQKFIDSQLIKIAAIADKIKKIGRKIGADIDLEVDGGINEQNARRIIEAGANILVAGSYIFGAKDKNYPQAIEKLRKIRN